MKKLFTMIGVIALLGAGCGAPTATNTQTAETAPTTALKDTPDRPTRSYDATDKNPGTSLNPIDKGREIRSDAFRYKLLDVRQDGDIFLVKLEIENLTPLTLQTSVAEAFLSERNDNNANTNFATDFLYPRSNIGVDLGGDISNFEPGQKVVGYYVKKLKAGRSADTMYFVIRNLGYNAETQKVDGVGGIGYVDAFRIR
ncbi:hypothetical protein IT407_00890 [Candidatus Uhrbacteria bacterium]|nr:hypothetical protein [Candidatus Uhrbacteria bacterium]